MKYVVEIFWTMDTKGYTEVLRMMVDFKRPRLNITASQSLGTLDYRQRPGIQLSAVGSRTILERSDGTSHTSMDTRSWCPISWKVKFHCSRCYEIMVRHLKLRKSNSMSKKYLIFPLHPDTIWARREWRKFMDMDRTPPQPYLPPKNWIIM